MPERSQAPSSTNGGRVNQKRRTRAAIVDAAQRMLERGESPTVAQAAEEALVSRTTAYRYFPTQESLLLELSLDMSVAAVEEVVLRPNDGTPPDERLLEMVGVFFRYLAEHETLNRTALRHYQDVWLAAERAGEGHDQAVRRGRRRQWIGTVLASARETLPDAEWRRLEAALSLVIGAEAFVVLRDVCRMEPDEMPGVVEWAVQALLDAAIRS